MTAHDGAKRYVARITDLGWEEAACSGRDAAVERVEARLVGHGGDARVLRNERRRANGGWLGRREKAQRGVRSAPLQPASDLARERWPALRAFTVGVRDVRAAGERGQVDRPIDHMKRHHVG